MRRNYKKEDLKKYIQNMMRYKEVRIDKNVSTCVSPVRVWFIGESVSDSGDVMNSVLLLHLLRLLEHSVSVLTQRGHSDAQTLALLILILSLRLAGASVILYREVC